VEAGTLPARDIVIPATLVDYIVVAPPEEHVFVFGTELYDGTLAGNLRAPSQAIQPVKDLTKKIMAHRIILEIPKEAAVVNLGVGLPENVAVLAKTHGQDNPFCASVELTAEAGTLGGTPMGGLLFGTARNADFITPASVMMDFYQGGGIDMTVLGLGETDEHANVNVSNFSGVMPGCGGFVDISQNSKKVVFMGTLTAGGLKLSWDGNSLHIVQEGKIKKFKKKVGEKTFAGASAAGRPVLFVTERAVFRIPPDSKDGAMELIEVAPGIDIEKDVVAQMEFRPIMKEPIAIMNKIFFEL